MDPPELLRKFLSSNGVDEFRTYVTSGGDVNFEWDRGQTLLHFACEHERLDLISELARNGANLETVPECGYPAIFVALDSDLDGPIDPDRIFDFPITKHLVSVGALTDAIDKKGRTMWQIFIGYPPGVKEQFIEAFGNAPMKTTGEQGADDQAPPAVVD